jgi:mono/diheme cytochrome c family protein
MSQRLICVGALLILAGSWLFVGSATGQKSGKTEPVANGTAATGSAQDNEALRLEGEKRFHANCGRCHQPPHKFPPRMMATIVRHMRVRATLTDEDMRAILAYMTQ